MTASRKKTEFQLTASQIYDAIRESILNLELKPGDKINQPAMAKKLNTSRTPVVNALHRLEAEGLVDSQMNSGFFVHRLSVSELLELFELREALDIVIVHNLISSITDDQIKELEQIFAHCQEKPDEIEQEEYRRLDMKFHSKMSRLCKNRMVRRVNESMQVFARSYTAGLLRPFAETLDEHVAILKALRDRDKEAAESACRRHISITKNILQETVDGMIRMGIDPDQIHVDEISLKK